MGITNFFQRAGLNLLQKVVLFIILVGFFLLIKPWYTIEQGERGVLLRFGKMAEISEPGFHGKIPLVDRVKRISVRTNKLIIEKLMVYSKDIQAATVLLSVNYAVNSGSVASVYTRFGEDYETRIVEPQVYTKAKDRFGQYNAVAIVQSRDKLAAEITNELREYLTPPWHFC
jgi:regulator of protease activity HflC (stomatin/prohibitin superfamily)